MDQIRQSLSLAISHTAAAAAVAAAIQSQLIELDLLADQAAAVTQQLAQVVQVV
jgi:hypothetical protein